MWTELRAADRPHAACPLWVISGHMQCKRHVRFTPKSGHLQCNSDVRFVPIANYAAAKWLYSITSSARASSVGGIVRPSALAVLRLMTNSNRTGSSTGRSAGLAPFKMRST